MPRPKTPLISRRKTLELALEIIDSEGLDALSIRRLAEALNVNGASLYHHFENKEDILVGVAQLALADVLAPQTHDEPWQMWIARNSRGLRTALLKHPHLIPVILRRGPLGVGSEQLEATALLLKEAGMPVGYIHILLRALEIVVIGSVLEETQGEESSVPDELRDRYPLLHQSSVDRALTPGGLFDALVRATITMIDEAIQQERPATGSTNGQRPRAGAKPVRKKPAPARRAT